jgi:hypothetical protein
MSDPAARQLLQTLTQDPDPGIRQGAFDAIEPAESPPWFILKHSETSCRERLNRMLLTK